MLICGKEANKDVCCGQLTRISCPGPKNEKPGGGDGKIPPRMPTRWVSCTQTGAQPEHCVRNRTNRGRRRDGMVFINLNILCNCWAFLAGFFPCPRHPSSREEMLRSKNVLCRVVPDCSVFLLANGTLCTLNGCRCWPKRCSVMFINFVVNIRVVERKGSSSDLLGKHVQEEFLILDCCGSLVEGKINHNGYKK